MLIALCSNYAGLLLLRLNLSNAPHFRSAGHAHGVDVDGGVGAMAKSGGRHLVGHQYGGRHLSAWLVPPDSLDHHQPKLWEMAVEKVRWSR